MRKAQAGAPVAILFAMQQFPDPGVGGDNQRKLCRRPDPLILLRAEFVQRNRVLCDPK
jgi:hypothetical protein